MSTDATYPPGFAQRRPDGSIHIPTGCTVEFESGSTLLLDSGATLTSTPPVPGPSAWTPDVVAHNTLGAAGALTLTAGKNYFPVIGSSGTARTGCTIPAGTIAGTKIAIIGTDSTATVSFTTNGSSGIVTPSPVTSRKLGLNDLWVLEWDATQAAWVEQSFSSISGLNNGLRIAKVALAAADTGGGVFSWANPESGFVVILRVVLVVVTVASGTCLVDVGTTAVSGTTLSDNLLDGVDLHAATGCLGLSDQAGIDGKGAQRLATANWVTATVQDGSSHSAALVGYALIEYAIE